MKKKSTAATEPNGHVLARTDQINSFLVLCLQRGMEESIVNTSLLEEFPALEPIFTDALCAMVEEARRDLPADALIRLMVTGAQGLVIGMNAGYIAGYNEASP